MPHVVPSGESMLLDAGFFEYNSSRCVSFHNERFVWSSADTSVFSVTQEGLAKAVAPGTTEVRFSHVTPAGDTTRSYRKMRAIPPIGSVSFLPQEASVQVGDTIRYRLTVRDTGGARIGGFLPRIKSSNYALARARYSEDGYYIYADEPGSVEVMPSDIFGLDESVRAKLTIRDSGTVD